jgi:uncharacterized membrane protein YidH (DUF202 family)
MFKYLKRCINDKNRITTKNHHQIKKMQTITQAQACPTEIDIRVNEEGEVQTSIMSDPTTTTTITNGVTSSSSPIKKKQKKRLHSRIISIAPRWKKIEVKDAVVRDMLAAERTHLAWVRTGLAFIALGIAVVKLLDTKTNDTLLKIAGSFFVSVGLLCVLYSLFRYLIMLQRIEKGSFFVDIAAPYFFGIFTVASAVFAFFLIFYR